MKKIISILLVFSLVLSLGTSLSFTASASGTSFSSATAISVNSSYSDNISNDEDVNYYKFTLSSPGSICLNFKHANLFDSDEYWVATIYDTATNYIASYSFAGTDTNIDTYKIGLDKGTYYLEITGGDWYPWGSPKPYSRCFSTTTYTFTAKYTSSQYWEKENNNGSMQSASNVYLNKEYSGSICEDSDVDYYKFTLSSPGSIYLNFKHANLLNSDEHWVATIYDNATNYISSYSFTGTDTNINTYKIGLDKGTYYLEIIGGNWYPWGSPKPYSRCFSTTTYTFTAKYTSSQYWEKENNNENMQSAPGISLNKKYSGSICEDSDIDYYKFTLSYKMKVRLTFNLKLQNSDDEYYVATIYDSKTNELVSQSIYGNKSTTEFSTTLSPGSYYIKITGGNWYPWGSPKPYSRCFTTNDYSLTVNCGHVYNNVNNYKCGICGYTVTMPTLRQTNGIWYYYNKGVIDKSNTIVKYNNSWYHVNGGKWVKDTTLVKYNNKYYYVENGIKSYKNTLVYFEGKWRHVNNGEYVKDTTLVKYNNKYYYVKNGIKCLDNTLVFFEGKWRHVNNGKYVKDTTLVKYNNKYYYVKNGKKCMDNTLVFFEGKWRHVNNGKYVKDTTLVKYNNKWYYVKDGKKCKDNTIVKYNGKWYHVNNGKWVKDTTFVRRNGKYYYVKNGIVTYVTGKVKVGGKWYRVKDGIRV